MTVLAIKRDWGPNSAVSIVRIVTNSSIQDVLSPGWLEIPAVAESIIALNNGPFDWDPSDFVAIHFVDAITGKFIATGGLFSIFPPNENGVFTSVNPLAPIYPNLQGITAHAGGGQTNATQLNIGINVVTTVAAVNDSLILPTDVLGQTVLVINRAANTAQVYPASGDSINSGTPNTPINLAQNVLTIFYGMETSRWWTK